MKKKYCIFNCDYELCSVQENLLNFEYLDANYFYDRLEIN